MRSARGLLLAASALLLAACASGGGGGGGEPSTETTLQHSLGRITYATLAEGVDKIYRKYAIPVYRREEQFATVYIESEWVPREPFEDERAQGAIAARTRFVLNGRRSSGPVFRTTMTVENQIRTEIYPDWQVQPLTPEFMRYARGIIQDLEAEVRTGVR